MAKFIAPVATRRHAGRFREGHAAIRAAVEAIFATDGKDFLIALKSPQPPSFQNRTNPPAWPAAMLLTSSSPLSGLFKARETLLLKKIEPSICASGGLIVVFIGPGGLEVVHGFERAFDDVPA